MQINHRYTFYLAFLTNVIEKFRQYYSTFCPCNNIIYTCASNTSVCIVIIRVVHHKQYVCRYYWQISACQVRNYFILLWVFSNQLKYFASSLLWGLIHFSKLTIELLVSISFRLTIAISEEAFLQTRWFFNIQKSIYLSKMICIHVLHFERLN